MRVPLAKVATGPRLSAHRVSKNGLVRSAARLNVNLVRTSPARGSVISSTTTFFESSEKPSHQDSAGFGLDAVVLDEAEEILDRREVQL